MKRYKFKNLKPFFFLMLFLKWIYIKLQEYVTNSAVLICLQCGYQGCGREECGHALEHYKKPHSDCHVMVVESLYWSVWCFQCETKINIGCRYVWK